MPKLGTVDHAAAEKFLQTLRRLRVDKSKGIAKPYTPLLMTAVVLLIGKGKLRSPDIALDGGLVSAFKQLLARIFPDWKLGKSPDYPFRHLETDGVWRLVAKPGEVGELEASRPIGATTLRTSPEALRTAPTPCPGP